jgi:hypothetical protein
LLGNCPVACGTCTVSDLAAKVAKISKTQLSETKVAELTHATAVDLVHAKRHASAPTLHANHTQLAAALLAKLTTK